MRSGEATEGTRVVFLDVDGVLNSSWYLRKAHADPSKKSERWHGNDIDPEAVHRLNRLLLRSGAKVVISSSWRKGHTLQELRGYLHARGYCGAPVIGKTPSLWQDELGNRLYRGHEIKAWLELRPYVRSFVILDDDSDMADVHDHLVKTHFDKGLADEHVDRALEILQGQGPVAPPPKDTATLILTEDATETRETPLVTLGQSTVRVDVGGKRRTFSRRTGQPVGPRRDGWLLASHLRPPVPPPWRPKNDQSGGGE